MSDTPPKDFDASLLVESLDFKNPQNMREYIIILYYYYNKLSKYSSIVDAERLFRMVEGHPELVGYVLKHGSFTHRILCDALHEPEITIRKAVDELIRIGLVEKNFKIKNLAGAPCSLYAVKDCPEPLLKAAQEKHRLLMGKVSQAISLEDAETNAKLLVVVDALIASNRHLGEKYNDMWPVKKRDVFDALRPDGLGPHYRDVDAMLRKRGYYMAAV
jgi:predicted transcriptional regulator